jgi:hypothetical protein
MVLITEVDWGYIANALSWLGVGVFFGFFLGRTTKASKEAHEALDKINKLTHDSLESPSLKKTEEDT